MKLEKPEANQTLEEQLFDVYASNLSRLIPECHDLFLCPLCLRGYGRDALATHEITREHIIPRKLDGHLYTLTCRECNNRGGSELDAHLVRRCRAEDALTGLSHEPIRCRVQIGDGEMGADVIFTASDSPKVQILGIPGISNPELHAAAEQALAEGRDLQFHFSADLGFKGRHSWVAVLRIGYLLMFRQFGYDYVLRKSVQRLRRQIEDPGQELIPSGAITILSQAPPMNDSLSLLIVPRELRCFFAVLHLPGALDRHLGVVLPGLDHDSQDIYERWHVLGHQKAGMSSDAVCLPHNPEILTDPECLGLLPWIWYHLGRQPGEDDPGLGLAG